MPGSSPHPILPIPSPTLHHTTPSTHSHPAPLIPPPTPPGWVHTYTPKQTHSLSHTHACMRTHTCHTSRAWRPAGGTPPAPFSSARDTRGRDSRGSSVTQTEAACRACRVSQGVAQAPDEGMLGVTPFNWNRGILLISTLLELGARPGTLCPGQSRMAIL